MKFADEMTVHCTKGFNSLLGVTPCNWCWSKKKLVLVHRTVGGIRGFEIFVGSGSLAFCLVVEI